MTDEAKRCIEIIRHCGNSKDGSACPKCPFNLLDDEKDPCINQLFRKSADMIESLFDKNKQLEYTLVGVMHFVDKWLDDIEPYSLVDDPSGQVAIDRAAEARRITLEHIEDLTREMYRRGQELSEIQKQKDAAVEDLIYAGSAYGDFCSICKHQEDEQCEKRKHENPVDCWQWRGVKEGENDG